MQLVRVDCLGLKCLVLKRSAGHCGKAFAGAGSDRSWSLGLLSGFSFQLVPVAVRYQAAEQTLAGQRGGHDASHWYLRWADGNCIWNRGRLHNCAQAVGRGPEMGPGWRAVALLGMGHPALGGLGGA